VGHVLALQGEGLGRVRLDCAGRSMFWCRLAEKDGRYVLEIIEAADERATVAAALG